tara:strand:- start:145 stop:948 length:804 start_codon:yes stop_codon:yes gene_type:complete
MKKTTLVDGSQIFCITPTEGQMLYEHISGYLEHDLINIAEGDTIIDVGANIGVFGIRLSKMFANIQIIGFEPIGEIFRVLEKNAELSQNKSFKIFNWGISDKQENINFTYYPNSPALSTANPDMWSSDEELLIALEGNLDNPPSNWWWAKYIPKFLYPHIVTRLRKNAKIIPCKLKTLSMSIEECGIENIDLLKIDCEGNELKVLKGIEKKHWPLIKQIVTEVHDIDGRLDYICKMLKKLGFIVSVVSEPSMENTALYNVYAKQSNF